MRRRVHHALSLVADSLGLADKGAWHAAKATLGTDETVAARLESAADQAGERGGFASRASVLVSGIGPDTRREPTSTARLVAAAEAALAAGTSQLAKDLLSDVDDDALDDVSRGRLIGAERSPGVLHRRSCVAARVGAHAARRGALPRP